jgi:hypothetical protein
MGTKGSGAGGQGQPFKLWISWILLIDPRQFLSMRSSLVSLHTIQMAGGEVLVGMVE